MSKFQQINSSLLLLLVFTLVSSAVAYHLVIKCYDNVFAMSDLPQ